MTIDELIAKLQQAKAQHGGETKVKVNDAHPWTPDSIWFYTREGIILIDHKD